MDGRGRKIGRPCTVCSHPAREEIDNFLAAGCAASTVAWVFGLGARSVRRHAANHLPAMLKQAALDDRAGQALDVLAEVKRLYWKTVNILEKADTPPRVALAAIREARETLTLVGRLGGPDDRPPFDLATHPEWVTVRTILLRALEPFPEARAAAAEALLECDRVAGGPGNGP